MQQIPHMHHQAQLACASAASLSISVTLTLRLLLDLWQQLIVAAPIKSFQQRSVVTTNAVDIKYVFENAIMYCCYNTFCQGLGFAAGL